jgi:hypothetical protein
MFDHVRPRPAVSLATIGTLVAMASLLVVAAPGGAATPEKEYTANFKIECVIGPGSFNIKGTLTVETRAHAPESVTPGEELEAKEASSTITSPAELGNALYADGVREVRGKVTHFGVDATGAEPLELNIAKPAAFPEGLPYHAPVEENKATTFTAPSEGRSYPFGPYKVTATSGDVTLATNTEPGYREVSSGNYEATGNGVTSTLEGYDASGEKIIGPLTVACNAPEVTLATIPVISSETASSTSTTSTTTPTTSTTTTTTTTTSTTTSTSTEPPVEVIFHDWILKGSLTDKKLGETIDLPEGCTFNGETEIPGKLEGRTFCPPFTTTLKLLGLVPTTVGLNVVESEPVKGTITHGKTGGDLLFKSTAKDIIEITRIGTLGVGVPLECRTSEPVVFPLETESPSTAISRGASFKGETTLPAVTCGGALGSVLGPLITTEFSGPNNPFTFAIEP